ncbi:MAG TPA: serine hydrolase domain-containing protein, partial [Pseudonocardiaceae bacterium]|nr:serine hydrolase domain-containing protein [Pseudonocardiaceae bacterium]
YVDDGRLPGWLVLASRRGRIAYLSTYGHRDIEAGLPVQPDTLFRIYSMTKPITSVAAMMLYEQGAFQLTDPISWYLPEFADMRVFVTGTAAKPVTVPAKEPIRVWHLLTQTAGLTYGFHQANPVDAMYRAAGFEFVASPGKDLAASCAVWATLPLLFEPGTEWNYSISTDVLGRLVEVVGGKPLDDFFAERIFQPLAMTDTGFWVDRPHAGRLAALYTPHPATGRAIRLDTYGNIALRRPETLSGGDGLVSSAGDYHRFARMLACGGELDGVRLLGPRTVRYMIRNQLPGGADLETFGRSVSAEVRYEGVGFGLGFAVVQDPVAYRTLTSVGEFSWGGLASTAFWVDPVEDLIVLFLTQLAPSSTYPIRTQLRQLVNQALVD